MSETHLLYRPHHKPRRFSLCGCSLLEVCYDNAKWCGTNTMASGINSGGRWKDLEGHSTRSMEGAGSRDGIVLSNTTENEVSASTVRVTSTIQSWSQTGNKCRGGNHRPQMINHPATATQWTCRQVHMTTHGPGASQNRGSASNTSTELLLW